VAFSALRKSALKSSLKTRKPLCRPDCGSISEIEKGGERELKSSMFLVDQKESAILPPLTMTLFDNLRFVGRFNFVFPWVTVTQGNTVTWIRRKSNFC
jgi:hypothetical protein